MLRGTHHNRICATSKSTYSKTSCYFHLDSILLGLYTLIAAVIGFYLQQLLLQRLLESIEPQRHEGAPCLFAVIHAAVYAARGTAIHGTSCATATSRKLRATSIAKPLPRFHPAHLGRCAHLLMPGLSGARGDRAALGRRAGRGRALAPIQGRHWRGAVGPGVSGPWHDPPGLPLRTQTRKSSVNSRARRGDGQKGRRETSEPASQRASERRTVRTASLLHI